MLSPSRLSARLLVGALALALVLGACGGRSGRGGGGGGGGGSDAGPSGSDAGFDLGAFDGGGSDVGFEDSGRQDAGLPDLGGSDLGLDGGASDAGPADLGPDDLGPADSGPDDLGGEDLGPQDAGAPPPPWHVGSSDTLEIVTWNIRNFPSDARTPERVATLIDEMDVDLVAVQEIASVDDFDSMVGSLPEYDGVLTTHEYFNGAYQKTGYVFRSDQIRVLELCSLFEDDSWAFPRPPLQAELVVQKPAGDALTLLAIAVHLKASSGDENLERRRAANARLREHLDWLAVDRAGVAVVLLGDFNDELTDGEWDNAFGALLEEPADYEFLTATLAEGHEFSYVPFHSMIDHIVVNPALRVHYEGGLTRAIPLELQLDYDYVDAVSDHRPVLSVFPLQ